MDGVSRSLPNLCTKQSTLAISGLDSNQASAQEELASFSPSTSVSSQYMHTSVTSGRSPTLTDDEAKDQVIVAHLESIVRDMIHSVNIRNFEPQAHPWNKHMSPNARVVPGNLLQATEMDRSGYLAWLSNICAVRPHFFQTITDLMTTVKNEKFAEVIASKDTHGSPPGLVKPSIVMMEFRLFDRNTWRCISIRSVHGIQPMPGG